MMKKTMAVVAACVMGLALGACTTPDEGESTPTPQVTTSTSAAPQSRTVVVPEVTGETVDEAIAILLTAGLGATVTYVGDATVPAETVISVEPVAGTEVEVPGAQITLVASEGIPCPEGIHLPEGVDRDLVCGPAPAAATTLPSFDSPLEGTAWDGFVSPSGGLSCSWYEGPTVVCAAVGFEGTFPEDTKNSGIANNYCTRGLYIDDIQTGVACSSAKLVVDEIPELESAPVLEYGQTILSTDYPVKEGITATEPVACHSAEDGITCWQPGTGHGIKIAIDTALYW